MSTTETRAVLTGEGGKWPKRPLASYSRERRRSLPLTILLWLCVLYFVLPLWWLFVSSTKDNSALFSTFGLWFGPELSRSGRTCRRCSRSAAASTLGGS